MATDAEALKEYWSVRAQIKGAIDQLRSADINADPGAKSDTPWQRGKVQYLDGLLAQLDNIVENALS